MNAFCQRLMIYRRAEPKLALIRMPQLYKSHKNLRITCRTIQTTILLSIIKNNKTRK